MNPGFMVRFRPLGPWRIGPESGARDQVDRILHSDTLFSAVSQAMLRLGLLEEWMAATATSAAPPDVVFSSLFPCLEDLHFLPPPQTLWPPSPSPKVRWRNARFVPLEALRGLVAEQPPNDSRWYLDGWSDCLMPAESKLRSGPFRMAVRSHAAVDRLSRSAAEAHQTACLEFAAGGGFWGVVGFAGEEAQEHWCGPVQTALRLLADTGMGGERSLGWGRSAEPEFSAGVLPDLILPAAPPEEPRESANGDSESGPKPAQETAYFLLSLYSPAPEDAIDWQRGCYSLVTRGGRVESPVRSGEAKKLVRMVEEGSVVVAPAPPKGCAPDVAPDGFPHPVFRSGLALSIPLPPRQPERLVGAS
ncbi:MAG: hypothetical protein ABSD56_15390 [Bryobacteraceae bacterium]